MSIENIFPNKEQFDTMNSLLASIASNIGTGVKVKSFADVQRIVRLGLAKKVFAIGEQLSAERVTNLVVSKGESIGITDVSVNANTFLAAMGAVHEGVHKVTFDGAVWYKADATNIILADYGLTITGTPTKGDHIVITETTRNLLHDIVDFDKHIPKNNKLTHTLDLLLHDIYAYETIPFSSPQLLYYTDIELSAGNYKFTLDHARYGSGTEYDGTYMFTTTIAIPAAGGIRLGNSIGGWKASYAKTDVTTAKVYLYGVSSLRAEIGQSISTLIDWDGTTECTDLGTFTANNRIYYTDDGKHNFTERQAYGSNRWKHSVYRQWLNSVTEAVPDSDNTTVSNWWSPQTVWDRVPGGAKLPGYLNKLDQDLVNAMGEVQIKTALHACDRTGDNIFDITYDKVFLLSRMNVFGTNEYTSIDEGGLLEYFNNATNADRIKYQNGTARYWWLRTTLSSFASNVRYVGTSGGLGDSGANVAYGVVPACCIV